MARKPPTFRLRLVAAIAALAALGLATAGGLAYLVELGRTDARIAQSLSRAVSELHRYADAHPGHDAERLVDGAVAESVNAAGECTLGRAGTGAWTHAGVPEMCSRVLEEPGLPAYLSSPPVDQPVRVINATGQLGGYAFVTVPVAAAPESGAADVTGVYAVVVDRGAQRAQVSRSYLVGYLPVALGAVALIILAGWVTAGRILRPLREVAATAGEITAGPAGRPDISRRLRVDGPAEAVDLAVAINLMLDSLQAAFGSQRQLLDDVGHELRTPLTVIQGHLELMDAGDPDDVGTVRALALDELARMRRLTDSLVTLAAAEGPDFAKFVPMALAPWFDEVVDKARGLGEREWIVESRDEVWVLGDQHRLTEAMLELATNAVKYSAPGTTVTFGLRREDNWVRLFVRDQGRGVHPADQQRIFERFARVGAHGGQTTAKPGTEPKAASGAGLGLAIVHKIANVHGGLAELRSVPGDGAQFTLILPVYPAAPPPSPNGGAL
ncbi:MAG: HAMP domain-containing histidine kinase [Bifidobacteriaceae bacterium]|jgi:signal transduction histidine kinase|nr:HAMP domain-containing histidine kinase [Bifidobacteriaceae bacterium]